MGGKKKNYVPDMWETSNSQIWKLKPKLKIEMNDKMESWTKNSKIQQLIDEENNSNKCSPNPLWIYFVHLLT